MAAAKKPEAKTPAPKEEEEVEEVHVPSSAEARLAELEPVEENPAFQKKKK